MPLPLIFQRSLLIYHDLLKMSFTASLQILQGFMVSLVFSSRKKRRLLCRLQIFAKALQVRRSFIVANMRLGLDDGAKRVAEGLQLLPWCFGHGANPNIEA